MDAPRHDVLLDHDGKRRAVLLVAARHLDESFEGFGNQKVLLVLVNRIGQLAALLGHLTAKIVFLHRIRSGDNAGKRLEAMVSNNCFNVKKIKASVLPAAQRKAGAAANRHKNARHELLRHKGGQRVLRFVENRRKLRRVRCRIAGDGRQRRCRHVLPVEAEHRGEGAGDRLDPKVEDGLV